MSSATINKNQYEVLDVIGTGSFGKVCKVRRLADKAILVWKEINFGEMTEKEKGQLVAEVNILRELKNPFIVRYHDRIIDKASTTIYIIMEHCSGGDLNKLVNKHKREGTHIDEGAIWKVLSQCILALKECHHRRTDAGPTTSSSASSGRAPASSGGLSGPVLHRDLKPANILIDSKNNIKLGDFGLAKELNSKSQLAQTNVGTPFYMAPEIMNDKEYDSKSDIWSLGCLAYELAALKPPFDATNAVSLAVKVNQGRFARIPAKYSRQLMDVLTSMLQVDPRKRPTVDELEVSIENSGSLACSALHKAQFMLAEHAVHSRSKELQSREKAVLAKEQAVSARERKVFDQEQRLSQWERRLAAQQTALDKQSAQGDTTCSSSSSSSSSSRGGGSAIAFTETASAEPSIAASVANRRRSFGGMDICDDVKPRMPPAPPAPLSILSDHSTASGLTSRMPPAPPAPLSILSDHSAASGFTSSATAAIGSSGGGNGYGEMGRSVARAKEVLASSHVQSSQACPAACTENSSSACSSNYMCFKPNLAGAHVAHGSISKNKFDIFCDSDKENTPPEALAFLGRGRGPGPGVWVAQPVSHPALGLGVKRHNDSSTHYPTGTENLVPSNVLRTNSSNANVHVSVNVNKAGLGAENCSPAKRFRPSLGLGGVGASASASGVSGHGGGGIKDLVRRAMPAQTQTQTAAHSILGERENSYLRANV